MTITRTTAALGASLVVLFAGCGPRPVMRVTGDRSPDASESTGGGPPPPLRRGSASAPADATMDDVDSNGIVQDREDGDPSDDMDRGQDPGD